MGKEGSELASRLLVAAVAIPALLYLIVWAPVWGFVLLIAAAAGVTVWEYCSITYGEGHPVGRAATIVVAASLPFVAWAARSFLFEATVAAAIVVATLFLFTFRSRDRVSHQIGSSITALLYGGAFLGVIVALRDRPDGHWWVLLTLITVWMSDTGAYFVGRAIGNHPLYETVSPNKSIEGSIGGFAGSVAGAFFCNWLFARLGGWSPLGAGELLLFAIPANLLAQTGDLVESVVKRAHDVDDSGSILGGHGGLLDRIDGLIYAIPWAYICVAWILPNL